MKRRIVWLLGLTLAFLLMRPPAGLMDVILDRSTAGRLRLATPSGTLWHGQGLLATHGGERILRAWRPIEWRVRIALTKAAIIVELSEHGQQQLALALTVSGIRLNKLDLDVPLGVVISSIPHPVARAGWRGNLTLTSPGLICTWDGTCEGGIRAEWSSAGIDILPNRPLGDHEISLRALGQEFLVGVVTLEGDIHVTGAGSLDRQRRFKFEGFIEGDPEIVDRIPSIMERNARQFGQQGQVRIVLP